MNKLLVTPVIMGFISLKARLQLLRVTKMGISFRDIVTKLMIKFKETTVESVIWWINVTPKLAGFSVISHENSVLFWIAHFVVLSYIDFFSNFVNRIKLSEDMYGVIKANTNLSIVVVTVNVSVWFFVKRSLLITTMQRIREIDHLTLKSPFLHKKHSKLMRRIKHLIVIYYVVNFVNIYMIWIPFRMNLSSSIYTSYPCPGLDISLETNKWLCRGFIFFQDTTVTLLLVTYQCIFFFFITHTAAMYQLMSDEILQLHILRKIHNGVLMRRKLSDIIRRGLILNLKDCLRTLYSAPMGIDFATNVYFMCLFLSLTLEDWISLASPFIYCVIVFFLYCFLCQKLIDASVVFESSVYGCGWEQFDIREMKSVFIMLELARRPMKLYAANIIPIDLNTFAVTVQNMYKFVTALKV